MGKHCSKTKTIQGKHCRNPYSFFFKKNYKTKFSTNLIKKNKIYKDHFEKKNNKEIIKKKRCMRILYQSTMF